MTGEKLSREARARLDAMCETNDGFRLAELDLKLRGAGDINGTLQSGMAFDLKIANPTADVQILTVSREAAVGLLAATRTPRTRRVAGAAQPLRRTRRNRLLAHLVTREETMNHEKHVY